MRLLATITLCLFASLSNAQTKIQGIGFLKIGMTRSDAIDSLKTLLIDGGQLANNYGRKDDNKFYLLTDPYSPKHHKCNRVITIIIPWLTISTIDFKDCQLIFYNDTLVSFRSDCSSLIERALNLKYGEGEIDAVHNITTWRNDELCCFSTFQKYTSSEGKPILVYLFAIENIQSIAAIRQCDKSQLEQDRVHEDQKLKERLDKL